MRTWAVYNIKGGVGKTATAVNLAYLAARQGYSTLIWDLDPQGAATFYFRVKPKVKGTRKLIRGKRDLEEVIKGTDYERLDLLPADFAYRNMDLVLGETKRPTEQLQHLLQPLAADYDLLVLDCPPSISLVSENIFHAADSLIIPTIPTTLSQRTLEQLVEFVQGHELDTPIYTFFSMVDRRKRMHLEVMATPPHERVQLLKSSIPYLSDVEKMGLERAPVAEYAGRTSPAAQAYEALWEELLRRV